MIKNLLLVGAGGAAGSMVRYLVSLWVQPHSFPWATFIVNIIGSFMIGGLAAMAIKMNSSFQPLWLLLMAGFCGGFTTFSAFSLENVKLLQEGRLGLFISYTMASIVLGLLACVAGLKLFQ